MFEKIKRFYKLGLWSEAMVLNAVEKGVITEKQREEILGKK